MLLLAQRPLAQGAGLRIYFVDIGQGAGTLIVSPTGKTLLVDGGPPGGGTKVGALLTSLGIPAIDFTVVTHYHIDHISGVTELLKANRVAGIAFDNGDGPDVQPPGTSTSPNSTRGTYLDYVAATNRPGVTRNTIQPGQVIDLGGGVRVTCIVAGGRLLSGGAAAITNADLNTESISLLVEYNNFDYVVSGDLTGGGSTSTAKTPDIETYVGQMIGDVDVVQLNHHGSTTTSNQVYLSAVKAEVAVAQTGETNTFGHPNRETVNKYLNTPVSSGNTYAGTGVSPAVGTGPVFYQNEASPAGDDRVTQQGYTAAAAGHGGQGTLLLVTDGSTNYSLASFDDGGAQISAALHTYPVDAASPGATTDFGPTVIAQTSPVLPLAIDAVTVSAAVNDRESPITGVVLTYAIDGAAQPPIDMLLTGGTYQATIPAQTDGARVDYAITATAGGQTTTSSSGYFSGVSTIAAIRALNPRGEPLYGGYAARIRGTVTASAFSPGTNDDYVQDETGAVNVFRSTDTPTPFTVTTPGDTVEARGRIGFLGGRFRLDLTESVEKASSPYGIAIASPGPAPLPVATTIAALTTNPESFEGQFVSIANASIISGSIPSTPQALDSFVTISDGTGSFSMKIDDDTDIEGFTPTAPFTAVGIVQQDDFLRPFDAGYDLTPRSRVDLGAAAPAPAPLLTIAEARVDAINNGDGTTGADFVPDRLNQVVRIQGAVSSIDFRGGNGVEYYVQDGNAGIDLFSTSLNAGPFAVGDTVEATGAVTQFNGLTEVTVTGVTLLTRGAGPLPQIITLAQLGDGGAGEAFEAELVTVNNLHVVSGTFPAANASGNVTVSDGTGNLLLRVDSDTDIDGTPTPAGTFSVTALVGQFDVAPFDSGYQLLPRSLADIAASVCPTITINGTLPGGATGTPYSQTLTATGGTPPYEFTISAGTLPDGLALTTTGVVSGTPTTAGAFTFTVRAAGADNCAGAASFTVVIAGPAGGGGGIVISEFRTRGGVGGNDEFVEIYNNSDAAIDISGYQLKGSNNAGTASTRSTVPAGVILPPREHYLFVNTTATTGYSLPVPGNRGFTVGITDDGGVAIADATGATLDAAGLSDGSAYKEGATLTPVTANGNRSYERKPGGSAVALQDSGDNAADFVALSGVAPSLPNPQNVVLTAAPATVDFGSVLLADVRTQVVSIKNVLLASITLEAPAINGANATEFAASALATTTLAGGAETTTTVTFQPVSAGSRSAALLVTSTSAGTRTVSLAGLAVCQAINVTATLPAAEFGFSYSQTVSASGAAGPYTFRVSAGALAAGLVLDPSGILSGTPSALGTATFTIEASTAAGCTGTATFTLTVVDTTPPALMLPGNLTVTATSPAGAIVGFAATAIDLVDGSRPVTCTPASGSTFPIGSTTVACTVSDTHGNAASGSFAVAVTEPAQAGRMIGAGRIEAGATRHDFDFVVQERATGADIGALSYRVNTSQPGRDRDDRFDALATRAVFFNVGGVSPGSQPASGVDTVLFSGAGRWNGAGGYTFEARAVDGGEPGRGHDRFAITIRNAAGQIVASVDDTLDNGNIQSLRIAR